MRRSLLPLLTTALYSVSVGLPQILGLVFLEPAEFGSFSLLYLCFAMSSSFLLSVVSESWARNKFVGSDVEYLRTRSLISLVFSFLSIVLSQVFSIPIQAGVLAGAGVYFASVWSTGRFLITSHREWGKLFTSELLGLTSSLAVAATAFAFFNFDLAWLFLIWCTYGATATLVSRTAAFPSLRTAKKWCLDHSRHIRVLLPDSLLLDASSIGIPLIMAPFLGHAAFGRYRAISSIAFPVRLIMAAVRPALSGATSSTLRGLRAQSLMCFAAFGLGGAATVCVRSVPDFFPGLGTISELGEYAVHAGVFVAATTHSTVTYVVCRIQSSRRTLLIGRIGQTAIMALSPLAGMLMGGEAGAISGFTLGAVLTAAVWFAALYRDV